MYTLKPQIKSSDVDAKKSNMNSKADKTCADMIKSGATYGII